MNSLRELYNIREDLSKNANSMISILDSSSSMMTDIIKSNIKDISHKIEERENSINSLNNVLDSKSFLEVLFSSNDVIKFIEGYAKKSVTKDDILSLVKVESYDELQDSVSSFNSVKKAKKSGKISSDEFNELLGIPAFDCSDSFFESSTRARTKSEDFCVKYISSSDDYKIVYKDEKNEVCNVFSLYDFFNDKKFLNKEGVLETLATLGVNVISFKGIPSRDTSITGDSLRADYCFSPRLSNNSMSKINLDIRKTYISSYVYNSLLIKVFFDEMVRLGYGDILLSYFLKVMKKASKSNKDTVFSHIYFADKKENRDERVFLKTRNNGCLLFNKDFYFRRDAIFNIMKISLSVVSKLNNDLDLNELMKKVVFYGGHDFVAQGDDLNNFFVSGNEKSFKTEDNNKDIKEVKACGFDLLEDIVGNRKASKPKSFSFNCRGTTYKLDNETMSEKYGHKSNSGCLSSLNIIYFVIDCLDKSGFTEDEILRAKSYNIKENMFCDKITTRNGDGIKMKSGKYYCNNTCCGWSNVVPSLKKLFTVLEIDKSSVNVEF